MKRALVLGIGVALAGCSDKGAQQNFEAPPVPVQVAEIEVRDVPLYFEAMGVIKPSRSAEVKPQVSGLIKKVFFSEGEWVEEGALLYSIDDAVYLNRLQEVEAQLDQDTAHLNNARKKLERYKSLTKQDLISQVEWDELTTKISLHEAMVKAGEARLAAAKLDLKHCTIVAPIAGFAGKSALTEGNMAEGAPLVTLIQPDPLSVDFLITEKELQQITTNAPLVKVYAAGGEDYLAVGKVTFMDHAINPKSGMLAVSATLAKSPKNLWPGQSVRIQLYFGKKRKGDARSYARC